MTETDPFMETSMEKMTFARRLRAFFSALVRENELGAPRLDATLRGTK